MAKTALPVSHPMFVTTVRRLLPVHPSARHNEAKPGLYTRRDTGLYTRRDTGLYTPGKV